jgi:fumarate reductase subunit C
MGQEGIQCDLKEPNLLNTPYFKQTRIIQCLHIVSLVTVLIHGNSFYLTVVQVIQVDHKAGSHPHSAEDE